MENITDTLLNMLHWLSSMQTNEVIFLIYQIYINAHIFSRKSTSKISKFLTQKLILFEKCVQSNSFQNILINHSYVWRAWYFSLKLNAFLCSNFTFEIYSFLSANKISTTRFSKPTVLSYQFVSPIWHRINFLSYNVSFQNIIDISKSEFREYLFRNMPSFFIIISLIAIAIFSKHSFKKQYVRESGKIQ